MQGERLPLPARCWPQCGRSRPFYISTCRVHISQIRTQETRGKRTPLRFPSRPMRTYLVRTEAALLHLGTKYCGLGRWGRREAGSAEMGGSWNGISHGTSARMRLLASAGPRWMPHRISWQCLIDRTSQGVIPPAEQLAYRSGLRIVRGLPNVGQT